jgi:O-antigen chain-terminating methyltransferase
MVEANPLKIDVDGIMRRIRSEVAAGKAGAGEVHAGVQKPNPQPQVSSTPNPIGRPPTAMRYLRLFGLFGEAFKKLNPFIQNLARQTASLSVSAGATELRVDQLQAMVAAGLQQEKELRAWSQDLGQRENELRAWLQDLNQRENELRAAYTQTSGYLKIVEEKVHNLAQLSSNHAHDIAYLKGDLSLQRMALVQAMNRSEGGARKSRREEPVSALMRHEDESQAPSLTMQDPKAFDNFYLALENRFRGSRDNVKERIETYFARLVPVAAERKNGKLEILDLGCGRGEWLEMVREKGHTARGVDSSSAMAEECRARGLDVATADAIGFLQTLPAASLDVVTAFHLIEHLPFQALMELLLQTFRVLRQGGLAIVETPNPENMIVATHTFFLDPTHRHILPARYAAFLFDHIGFGTTEIVPLNPAIVETPDAESTEAGRILNRLLYGPQDYAVIAGK